MKQICEYKLEAIEEQIIEIPSKRILSVECRLDAIVVHALVDPTNPQPEKYEFRIYVKGQDIEDDIESFAFLGAFKMYNYALLFHIFYKKLD